MGNYQKIPTKFVVQTKCSLCVWDSNFEFDELLNEHTHDTVCPWFTVCCEANREGESNG